MNGAIFHLIPRNIRTQLVGQPSLRALYPIKIIHAEYHTLQENLLLHLL